ncbi:MAG: FtsX-like permease family protein [Bacillota bacterium]|nr:FtsX-like permease family protein [Bacillota bacterium]
MKKLFKKLVRDIRKSLGQFIAVTVVSTIGVLLLTGLSVTHSSMVDTANTEYRQSNIADLSVYYLGINQTGIDKIKSINGVADAYGRQSLKAESTDNRSGFFIHTVSSDEKINIPFIKSGKLPKDNDECMIDDDYASANKLSLGSKLSVVIDSKPYTFNVSGTFVSSEYIFLVEDPSKSIIPDHKNFGLLYLSDTLTGSLSKDGTYNEVLVTLKKNPDINEVSKKIESLTENYGFGNIIQKKDQLSYYQLKSDIDSSGSISKIFPYIFFLVAAVIIFISMSRTIQSERNQIGIMKALGISSFSVKLHYLSYSVLSGFVGSILGNLLGIVIIPKIMFDTYKMLYTFNEIQYSGFIWYVVVSTIVVILFGFVASLLSIRKVLKEVPAQCMRPLPPKKVHKTWLEKREKLWKRISYKNKLIIRNILLNKRRAILSSIGIIGCVGVLMCAFGLKEAMTSLIDKQFGKIQSFDSMVVLSEPQPYTSPVPFTNTNIAYSDKFSVVDTVMALKENVNSELYVLPRNARTIGLYDNSGKKLNVPTDGIVVPLKLAKDYGINVGDTISMRLESQLYGNMKIKVRVAAIDVLYVSQDLYASYEYLESLGVAPFVNGYYINLKDMSKATETNAYLSGADNVKTLSVKSQLRDETESTMKIMDTLIYIMVFMSACLALAVIFNISSINIFERRRDIATLKVLGYHKKEINSLVHIENLVITAFGSIFGVFFGMVIYKSILDSAVSKDMYLPYEITAGMVGLSVILAFVFTLLTNYLLKGKTRKIDMIESLKSVE